MSNEVIVFKNDDGGISLIHPTGPVQAAIKDVPEGKKFLIIDGEDLPKDRMFRNAWDIDESLLTEQA